MIHKARLSKESKGKPSEKPANGLNSDPKIVPSANPPNMPPKKPPNPVRGVGVALGGAGFRTVLSRLAGVAGVIPGL